MEKETLIQLAYTFFPKGLSYDDKLIFESSKEFRHLVEVTSQSEELSRKWHSLLNVFQRLGYSIEEIGYEERPPRSFRIAIRKKGTLFPFIVVTMSKLIPFFSLYSIAEKYDFSESDSPVLFQNFSIKEREISNEIEGLIRSEFTEFDIFPADLINVEVEDIEYGELGIVKSKTDGYFFTPMTLYNVYFANFLFY
ncbi:hypothetical protein HHL16_22195 [Pseudoflavitalea sp. G-6-1-2]|uniref:hypothetical protein n=1 Tax=Pseudoflavitalea sp. G-6-1-2 TaxID=2728841 RepID=UPI00146E94EA|nr:hypothetical protein [Pseudoflavitalea sp. G-6-1-2]NML23607.1 hypothetical protein [Pseudoflavitalea sp. G-6-1-2]